MSCSAYAAVALSLLLIGLSLNVSRLRLRYRQSFGDGGQPALAVAIRAHGNCLEQSLLFLALLYLLELQGGWGRPWLVALTLGFVVLRLLYCVAVFRRRLALRQASHGLTMALLLAATLMLLLPGALL